MAVVSFLLQALAYPKRADFDLRDSAQLQALVVWLENSKIRAYPIAGRQQLADPGAWQQAFGQYLKDTSCPYESGPSPELAVQWLLSHAVGLEYQDQAEKLNALAKRVEGEATPAEQWSEAQLPPFEDVHSDAVAAALRDVQRGLGLGDGPVTAESLRQAHAVLESQVLPALMDPSKPSGSSAAPAPVAQRPAAEVLGQYPLGFSTGAAPTDMAATILRILYIQDLRALQTAVDESIVQAQEYTANPRTDSALGKVGR